MGDGIRIIVEHNDDYTSLYDASTDEKWAANSQALLAYRFNSGYYYHEPSEPEPYTGMPKEEIEALTDPDVRKVAVRKYNDHIRSKRNYKEQKKTYDEIVAAVNMDKPAWVTYGNGRSVPLAWALLEERSDYEHERVELEYAGDVT